MKKISNKKNYLLSIFSSFSGQLISILISFISVPISLEYWGEERYGLFTLINSLIVYLNISNLGINSSSAVLLAKNNNYFEKLKIIKRSFIMIFVSVVFYISIFFIINNITDRWVYFIGDIPNQYFKETYTALYLMILLFLVNTIFSLVDSIFIGFQILYIQKFLDVFISIFSFLALIITILIKGKLGFFVFLLGIVKLLFSLIKLLYFYLFIYKKKNIIINSSKKIENSEISYKNILVLGLRFFLIGIAAMVVWNTDNLVINHFLSTELITPYSITFKVYNILFTLIFILNGSMIPIIAKEFGNDNWEWINKTYEKLLKSMAIFGGLLWLGGVLFIKNFILFWTGKTGYGGMQVIVALGGYSYLLSMVNLNSGIATAFNYTKGIVWIGWIEAIFNFLFSIILLKKFGIGGVAMGTVLGSLIGPTVLFPLHLKKFSLGKLEYDYKFILRHLFNIILPMLVLSIIIQLFVSNIILKITFGILLIIFYLFFSTKILSDEIKVFLINELKLILNKVGIKHESK